MASKEKEEQINGAPLEESKMSPYDLVKLLYENRAMVKSLREDTLSKNAFMVNRIMSIQYPLQADTIQKTGCSPRQMFYVWCSFLENIKANKVPQAVYVKGRKKLETELFSDIFCIPAEDLLPLSRFAGVECKTIQYALSNEYTKQIALREYEEYKEHEERVTKQTSRVKKKDINDIL